MRTKLNNIINGNYDERENKNDYHDRRRRLTYAMPFVLFLLRRNRYSSSADRFRESNAVFRRNRSDFEDTIMYVRSSPFGKVRVNKTGVLSAWKISIVVRERVPLSLSIVGVMEFFQRNVSKHRPTDPTGRTIIPRLGHAMPRKPITFY